MSSSSNHPQGVIGRVEVLTQLQDYAKVQEDGNLALKACVWQLTKSRRNRNQGILSVSMGSAFSADLLREDLRARTLVVQDVSNSDPRMGDLVDDDNVDDDNDDSKKPQSSSPPTSWKLVDAVEERARNKETTTTTSNTNTKGVGLRQRKGNDDEDVDDDDETAKEWTMVEEEQVSQEEELLRLDPLEFFGGLRPRELKLAQEQAKLALESYIQAANQAAKILALLNTQ